MDETSMTPTPTPDRTETPPAAPLTAEQIAAMRANAARVYSYPRTADEPFYVCRDAVRLADECAALRDRLARAEARCVALVAIIEEAQWMGKSLYQNMAGWEWCCPFCEHDEKDGHSPDCAIALALATPTAPYDGAMRAGDAEMVKRIRALHFAIPFTINTAGKGQMDDLAARVSNSYMSAYGIRPDEAQMRRVCGLSAADGEAT